MAQLSTDWLDMVDTSQTRKSASEEEKENLREEEKENLREAVAKIAKPLIEARENSLKQALVTESAAKLAEWLGRQRANDLLLQPMVKFLKYNDRQLRYTIQYRT